MKYISTRNKDVSLTAAEAIFSGIAPDGGLYIPESIPNIDFSFIESLSKKDYKGRAKDILALYLEDFTKEEIDTCVENAYTGNFENNNPAPVTKEIGGLHYLELWHGPTSAFKDMALQLLPELLKVSAKKVTADKEVVILVATSGDTGKAALEGFCNVKNTKIIVFYPKDGVSSIQKKQMCTQEGDNVCVVGIDGNFDDAQRGVKEIFTNEEIKAKLFDNGYVFSSANSINWGRLLPQIVYYFSAYCDLLNAGTIKMGEEINFSVPTGNFGDILAAYYAKMMGLPVNMLICASNKNRVLTDFIATGIYDKNREFYKTNSPSMDILVSSNAERLLFYLTNGNTKKVSAYMDELKNKGSYTLSEVEHIRLKKMFYGEYCNEVGTINEIGRVFENDGYIADTHTAVAVYAAKKYLEDGGDGKTVVVSTASPYKFSEAVLSAISKRIENDDFKRLELLSELTNTHIPERLYALKDKEVRFTETCAADGLKDALYKFLDI